MTHKREGGRKKWGPRTYVIATYQQIDLLGKLFTIDELHSAVKF